MDSCKRIFKLHFRTVSPSSSVHHSVMQLQHWRHLCPCSTDCFHASSLFFFFRLSDDLSHLTAYKRYNNIFKYIVQALRINEWAHSKCVHAVLFEKQIRCLWKWLSTYSDIFFFHVKPLHSVMQETDLNKWIHLYWLDPGSVFLYVGQRMFRMSHFHYRFPPWHFRCLSLYLCVLDDCTTLCASPVWHRVAYPSADILQYGIVIFYGKNTVLVRVLGARLLQNKIRRNCLVI